MLHEDEIRSVEGPDAKGTHPKEPAREPYLINSIVDRARM
jgi:hypothetical protein